MQFGLEMKAAAAAVVLAILWLAESAAPFYACFAGAWKDRVRHDLRNMALGALNAALVGLLFVALMAKTVSWAEAQRFGLLRLIDWFAWAETLLALVLFDLWMYLWHRANHVVPLLWRFHRMHHSDPQMDATTAVRFHTGEVLFSVVARLAVVPLLGMTLWQLALYEAILLPVILFHHSNVWLPRWIDHGLLALIVTPAMHRVHHSRWLPETNSNYASVLPYWDYLARTFRLRDDAHTIELGLDGLDAPAWQSLWGLLRTPFGSR